jgi:hypothetical protein
MKLFSFVSFALLAASAFVGGSLVQDPKPAPAVEIPDAHSTHLTTDHQGNLVLSWVKQNHPEAPGVLQFAVSRDQGRSFGQAVTVPLSRGASSAHGESPPKIAFKKDGTILALFRMDEPAENNPYGGDVYLTTSPDGGKTWSAKQSVGGEKGRSRSFFDLQTLPSGEVGALWLEGRGPHEPKEAGSTIRFAATTPGQAFGKSVVVSASVCQCCRVKLYVDEKKQIHAVFRKIFADGARDMAHSFSIDQGRTFSEPRNISPDKWVIDGCPHVGPDMVAVGSTLHFTWFTMGGKGDVYTTSSSDNGRTFAPRSTVAQSDRASHPSLAAFPGNSLLFAWDESADQAEGPLKRIGLRIQDASGKSTSRFIQSPHNLIRPLVWGLDQKTALVSYTKKEGQRTDVVYERILVR